MGNNFLCDLVWFGVIALLWGAEEDLGEGSKCIVFPRYTWLIDFTYTDIFLFWWSLLGSSCTDNLYLCILMCSIYIRSAKIKVWMYPHFVYLQVLMLLFVCDWAFKFFLLQHCLLRCRYRMAAHEIHQAKPILANELECIWKSVMEGQPQNHCLVLSARNVELIYLKDEQFRINLKWIYPLCRHFFQITIFPD